MTRLRLAFMGTPDFAVPALIALHDAGHDLAAVYSQPPRPTGRGHTSKPSPVARAADDLDLPVRTPNSLPDADVEADFAALDLDAAVVTAYGLILPATMLASPKFGCLNIHASLLPRWRGAAPIQRAILAGDGETGITIMQMAEGLDSGPILSQEAVPIAADMTAGELHDRLANVGARLIVATLETLATCAAAATPQDEEGATYAAKVTPDEARLDWRQPAAQLERQVRAFAPRPGAWFADADERIRVLSAEARSAEPGAAPGTVLDDRLTVATGDGALRLLQVQRASRSVMSAEEFLRGFPIAAGDTLDVA